MFKVLVPTDFSDCATHALNAALQIAQKLNGEIHLYHRADIPHNWHQFSEEEKNCFPEIKTRVAKTKRELQAISQQIERKYQSVKIITSFSYGHLLNNILTYAESYEIDLIVMGSHGASGISEWLIGSNTQKIVRLAPCPVLTIKQEIESIDFNHITFVSNFDTDLKPAFRKLIEFARCFDAHIHLLTIDTYGFYSEPQYAVLKSMEEFARMCGDKVPCTLHQEHAFNTIKGLDEFVCTNSIQVLAMATHGRKYLARAVMGSLAETVVNHLDMPVLTINLQAVKQHPEFLTPPYIKKENQREITAEYVER